MNALSAANIPAKVLVIDDELGPRESLRILLKNQYQVFCADSVDLGLQLLRQHVPDVIVMDIRMPGKSGIEGLREIRAQDPLISVVMLTGFGALETAQEAIRLGANDYLKKPFDTTDMVSVIQHNVQRTRLERRRASAEQELQALNTQLLKEISRKDHLASLGQRSAEIAHDLRNPLTTVIGYIELLSEDLRKSRTELGSQWQEAIESLEMIENNVWRCKELTDMWMNLGRGDTQPQQLVRLYEFVEEVVKGLEPRALARNTRFSLVGSGMEGMVLAHRVQLFRALSNVLVNALEAVSEHDGQVQVRYRCEGGLAIIDVQDNGAGVPADQLARVFEPYYTTKQVTGTGLGLFITKTVIEDHRGTIDMDSAPGLGTKVTIRLPLHEAAV